MSVVGLNFTINITWESLIRLSPSKKWPKNQFSDTRGANYMWLSQCTVAPTAESAFFFGTPCMCHLVSVSSSLLSASSSSSLSHSFSSCIKIPIWFCKKNIFCGSQILSNWIYKIGQTKNQNALQWRCFLPANSIDDKFIKSIDVLPFCYPHDFNFSSYLEEEASSATSFMLAFSRCNNIFSIARLCTLVAIFELVNLRSFANDNDIQPAHVIKRLIDSITRFSNFDCVTGQWSEYIFW